MKCPKCRYLSFEPELRCKHCGYDFSLAEPAPDAEPAALELIRPRPDAPKVFRRAASAVAVAEADRLPASAALRPAAIMRPGARAAALAAGPAPSTGDLPLFARGSAAALPATVPAPALARRAVEPEPVDPSPEPADIEVAVPAAPRPLAVRRSAPDSGRVARASLLDAAELPASRADRQQLDYIRRVEVEAAPAVLPSAARAVPAEAVGAVPPGRRLAAAAVDAALLFGLNLTVFLLTLRQCGLALSQVALVPVVPLTTFLASLTVAYVLLFSVFSGQTIGKMIFGLRVVSDSDAASPATPRQVSIRALLALASMILLGLGFLPALVGTGRAIHDRLTHTRVVRA